MPTYRVIALIAICVPVFLWRATLVEALPPTAAFVAVAAMMVVVGAVTIRHPMQ